MSILDRFSLVNNAGMGTAVPALGETPELGGGTSVGR
jgi:hypothetical protein